MKPKLHSMDPVPVHTLLEVVDADNRVIGHFQSDLVHRQLLPHRSALVLLFNSDNKLFLQRKSEKASIYPGRWDMSARTHVRPGEAALDAAFRKIRETLGLDLEHLKEVTTLPPSNVTGFEQVTLLVGRRINTPIISDHDEIESGFFYSSEELACLVKDFRELLTPGLITLWESGMIDF